MCFTSLFFFSSFPHFSFPFFKSSFKFFPVFHFGWPEYISLLISTYFTYKIRQRNPYQCFTFLFDFSFFCIPTNFISFARINDIDVRSWTYWHIGICKKKTKKIKNHVYCEWDTNTRWTVTGVFYHIAYQTRCSMKVHKTSKISWWCKRAKAQELK